MGQLYLQRFEYRGAIGKAEFDQAWGVGLETFAKTGNFGGVEKGLKHIRTYGTAWGGYSLLEVEDPPAFAQYQMHHPTATAIWRGSRSSPCSTWTPHLRP